MMPRTITGPAGSYRVTIKKELGWTVLRATDGTKQKILATGLRDRDHATVVAEELAEHGKAQDPFSSGRSGYLTDAEGMLRARQHEQAEREVQEEDEDAARALRDERKFSSVTKARKKTSRGSIPESTNTERKETEMATATETEETTEPEATEEKPKRTRKTKGSTKSKAKGKGTKKTTEKKAPAKPRASAEEFGDRVVELRADGLSWRTIAEELGLGTPGVARRIWSQTTGEHHSMSRISKGGRLPQDPEVLEQMRERGLLGDLPEELQPLVGKSFKELDANEIKAAVKAMELEPEGRKKSDLVRALVGAGLPEPEGLPEA